MDKETARGTPINRNSGMAEQDSLLPDEYLGVLKKQLEMMKEVKDAVENLQASNSSWNNIQNTLDAMEVSAANNSDMTKAVTNVLNELKKQAEAKKKPKPDPDDKYLSEEQKKIKEMGNAIYAYEKLHARTLKVIELKDKQALRENTKRMGTFLAQQSANTEKFFQGQKTIFGKTYKTTKDKMSISEALVKSMGAAKIESDNWYATDKNNNRIVVKSEDYAKYSSQGYTMERRYSKEGRFLTPEEAKTEIGKLYDSLKDFTKENSIKTAKLNENFEKFYDTQKDTIARDEAKEKNVRTERLDAQREEDAQRIKLLEVLGAISESSKIGIKKSISSGAEGLKKSFTTGQNPLNMLLNTAGGKAFDLGVKGILASGPALKSLGSLIVAVAPPVLAVLAVAAVAGYAGSLLGNVIADGMDEWWDERDKERSNIESAGAALGHTTAVDQAQSAMIEKQSLEALVDKKDAKKFKQLSERRHQAQKLEGMKTRLAEQLRQELIAKTGATYDKTTGKISEGDESKELTKGITAERLLSMDRDKILSLFSEQSPGLASDSLALVQMKQIQHEVDKLNEMRVKNLTQARSEEYQHKLAAWNRYQSDPRARARRSMKNPLLSLGITPINVTKNPSELSSFITTEKKKTDLAMGELYQSDNLDVIHDKLADKYMAAIEASNLEVQAKNAAINMLETRKKGKTVDPDKLGEMFIELIKQLKNQKDSDKIVTAIRGISGKQETYRESLNISSGFEHGVRNKK